MPIRRQFAPREISAADLQLGRVDPQYHKVVIRLLSAHAMAEKLTAQGYERALQLVGDDPVLKATLSKNRIEEVNHSRLVYRALAEIDVNERQADRMMITALKGPSFEAPRYFAERVESELDLLMATVSVDMTGLLMIGINYKDSSYGPHSRAAELILDEEAEHDVFSSDLLTQAVERWGVDEINAALREWFPRAVNFFGPPESGFTYDCLRFGLKARDNNELAELYISMLERRTDQLGITLPRLTPEYPHRLAD
jgi:ring-1,2-phenylacetyl-CoA epoxidase subunit PaaA